MMSLFFVVILTMFSHFLYLSSSPMKFSVILLLLSMFCFNFLNDMMGNSWFPLTFILLFAGGIIMMFMIISSVMPNEKPKKFNFYFPLIFCFLFMFPEFNIFDMSVLGSMKNYIYSSTNFYFVLFLILFYFLAFILFISKQDGSLRSLNCLYFNKFVIYFCSKAKGY